MASATFNAKLTFTPPASNTIFQTFGLTLDHSAVSMATVEVAKGSATSIEVEFGGATNALGIVVKNNLDVDVEVIFNAGSTASYEIAPGGMFMNWAPVPAKTTNLTGMTLRPAGAGATEDGTIEYVVLGK